MPSRIGSTILKLAILSLLIGLALSVLDIHPRRLLENFGETVQSIFEIAVSMVEWAVPYVLLGAVVVVPIWVVSAVLRVARAKKE